MSSIPDYMKILKSPEKVEEFVNIQERYNDHRRDQKEEEEEENPCLSGTYSRRNALFIFVTIAILICVIYMLINKDIP